MQFLDKKGLKTFLNKLKPLFCTPVKEGSTKLKPSLDTVKQNMEIRQLYLLNIDYENTLAFDTDFIIGGSAASSASVGVATVGSAIVGNS